MTFLNYAYADGGLATTQPLTRLPTSYTRLNLEDDLKWQPNRMWAFGIGYLLERYTYENGEVNATNEGGAKAYIDKTLWSWLTGRASVQYRNAVIISGLVARTTPMPHVPCANFLFRSQSDEGECNFRSCAHQRYYYKPQWGHALDRIPDRRGI